VLRTNAYASAWLWSRYVGEGLTNQWSVSDEIFSFALCELKGIHCTPPPFINATIALLKDKFGINCRCRDAIMQDKSKRQLITLTSDAHQQLISKKIDLIDQSCQTKLPILQSNELGTKENPFANVDEAADFILNLEKRTLANDAYRQDILREQYFYDINQQCFRIPWASANVSYYRGTNVIENGFVVNQFQNQELIVLLNSHPLVKLLGNGIELFHDYFRFEMNYYGLSQHYYNKTSLLDLTSDMNAAKFFAVTTFNFNQDKYEKYDGNGLGVLYYFDIQPDSFTNEGHQLSTIGKQVFMRSGAQRGFLLDMSVGQNFNDFPEVRYVFFRHNSTVTDRIFNEAMGGDKYMANELLRTHWYNRMSDPINSKVISRAALNLNFAFNKGTSHRKIVNELRCKGFHIDPKLETKFSDEELDVYYSTALQNWEQFCEDIYFYSPEGRILKNHLLNVPNDPRYRWAFVR
jgi:hypothetical protein